VTSCKRGIFLISVLIDITVAISAVYLNSQRTIVFGCNRRGIGFGKHSVELLIGGETFDLDCAFKLSSVQIREIVHQSDCVVERVEAEACGDCFGYGFSTIPWHSSVNERALSGSSLYWLFYKIWSSSTDKFKN